MNQQNFTFITFAVVMIILIVSEIYAKGWKEGLIHLALTIGIGTLLLLLFVYIHGKVPK